ncbi:MAG TPA: hypothetical protein VF015_02655 [Acidimicrobiales bacterium]
MTGTDESDDSRLAGRTPRAPRRELGDDVTDDDGDGPDDHEIEAVNRLMGFLRSTDEG